MVRTGLLPTLVLAFAICQCARADELLERRDSCAAVASSIVAAAGKSNSLDSLRANTKAAYLRMAGANGASMLPLHRIEEPIDMLINTYGAQVLDQLRGGMFSTDIDQFVQGVGFAMAFTSATCMAILTE